MIKKQNKRLEAFVNFFKNKSLFDWIDLIVLSFLIFCFFDALPTLKRWSWGYWSVEYVVTLILFFVYYVIRELKILRDKLDLLLRK